jgi:hypothetical protein
MDNLERQDLIKNTYEYSDDLFLVDETINKIKNIL